jgi:hypothetical protein
MSGALELAVAEVGETADHMPQAVTRALTLTLEHLAGETPSEARVAALCVGDRQFLMRELDRHLGAEGGWFQAHCRHCGEPFDFPIDYAALPVREAGPGFPQVQIEVEGRRLHFRLPTGADQEELVAQRDTAAHAWLLKRLAQESDLPEGPHEELTAAVEAALETIAPAIVLIVQTACPGCGGGNEVELDPYRVFGRSSDRMLEDVHRIALYYHWSESDILDLPRGRRQRYLRLIDQARGMTD